MNCYLSRNYKGLSSAGNKAKTDIEQIMEKMSFRNVGLRQTTYTNEVLSFLATLTGVLKSPFCLHKGDKLVLQYPLKKYFSFVCNMAHLRGAKVIVLIHDLGSFRRKALTVAQEIKRLNHADYIIAHNEKMKNGWKIMDARRNWVYLRFLTIYLSPRQLPNQMSRSRTVYYMPAH